MEPLTKQLASQVCAICKTRKKRCDKVLPECGYCTARQLKCRYDESASTIDKGGVSLSPGKWLQYTPTPRDSESTIGSRGAYSLAEEAPISSKTSLSETPRVPEVIGPSESTWTYLCRILSSQDLSMDALADRFFDGAHTWLPIIAPRRFRISIESWPTQPLPPDSSVLALAMCLIVLGPPLHHARSSPGLLQELYVSAKSSFARVQIVKCASVPMIQAGILLAAYEYACGRLESAYVSLGMASRMCHIAGIGGRNAVAAARARRCDPRYLEERNVWWGLLSLER